MRELSPSSLRTGIEPSGHALVRDVSLKAGPRHQGAQSLVPEDRDRTLRHALVRDVSLKVCPRLRELSPSSLRRGIEPSSQALVRDLSLKAGPHH